MKKNGSYKSLSLHVPAHVHVFSPHNVYPAENLTKTRRSIFLLSPPPPACSSRLFHKIINDHTVLEFRGEQSTNPISVLLFTINNININVLMYWHRDHFLSWMVFFCFVVYGCWQSLWRKYGRESSAPPETKKTRKKKKEKQTTNERIHQPLRGEKKEKIQVFRGSIWTYGILWRHRYSPSHIL